MYHFIFLNDCYICTKCTDLKGLEVFKFLISKCICMTESFMLIFGFTLICYRYVYKRQFVDIKFSSHWCFNITASHANCIFVTQIIYFCGFLHLFYDRIRSQFYYSLEIFGLVFINYISAQDFSFVFLFHFY